MPASRNPDAYARSDAESSACGNRGRACATDSILFPVAKNAGARLTVGGGSRGQFRHVRVAC
jgi:hypothetical protein